MVENYLTLGEQAVLVADVGKAGRWERWRLVRRKEVESERRTTAAVRVVRGVSCARACGGLLVPRLPRLWLVRISAVVGVVRVVGRGTGRLRARVHAKL